MSERDAPVVVVGGGLGGLRTVEALRRLGHEGRVVLVSEEEVAPYDRPPLSKRLLDDTLAAGPTYLRPVDGYQGFCELELGQRAVALDPAERVLLLESGRRIGYGKLVLAPGTVARPIDVLGPSAHVIRTHADALALRERILEQRRLVVVGAGFMGCEVASAAAATGVQVTLLEGAPTPLHGSLGPVVGAHVAALQAAAGVDLRCGVTVLGMENGSAGDRLSLRDADGSVTTVEAPVLAVCVGATPATSWLAGSGLELDPAIVCDDFGRTSLPDVYAVGDAAAWRYPGTDRPLRVEHWTTTTAQAVTVAQDLVARQPGPGLDPLHYFWSDQCGVKLQCFGLPEAGDTVEHVVGADGRSLLATYGRDGRVTAVLGIGRPKPLLALRALLLAGDPFDDVVTAMTRLSADLAPAGR